MAIAASRLRQWCCSLVLAANVAGAAEHVVAPADDWKQAFRDPAPGDVFVLKDGEWKDKLLVVEGDGTLERPIVVRAQTPGEAKLTGRSRLKIAGRLVVVSGLRFDNPSGGGEVIQFRTHSKRRAEDCRLTDCAVVNDAEPGDDDKWVSIYGSRNRVDHCWFEGKRTGGATLVVWIGPGEDGHRIDHNDFGPRPPLGRNGGSATSMSAGRRLVEDNLFRRCDGEEEILSNKSCENVYRRNTFRECSGALRRRGLHVDGTRCRHRRPAVGRRQRPTRRRHAPAVVVERRGTELESQLALSRRWGD